jgi:tetratricopeptide (TPR) repeat protein
VRLWKQISWRCWLRTCLRRLGNNWTYDKEGIAARARLFEEGYSLAEQNEIEPAINHLKQALQSGADDEALSLSAKRLIAPIVIQQGQRLARSGDYEQALTKFELAKQLNPHLSLDPVFEANRLTAPILQMQGTFAARAGKISEAIAKFEQAKQYGLNLEFEPEAEAKRIAALTSEQTQS